MFSKLGGWDFDWMSSSRLVVDVVYFRKMLSIIVQLIMKAWITMQFAYLEDASKMIRKLPTVSSVVGVGLTHRGEMDGPGLQSLNSSSILLASCRFV
jgi:hypothetical protein